MHKSLYIVLALVVFVTTTLSSSGHVAAEPVVDVSWPNCKAAQPTTNMGIVGVTGGLDFKQNHCVRQETGWFVDAALYMNSGWPGTSFHLQFPDSPRQCSSTDSLCLAYNYGFHAAEYAIAYANNQLLQSSRWWIDVETENSWTNNILQNRAALTGMVAAIQQKSFAAHVGFYSYPGQWTQIVGDWQPDFPAWVATGTDSLSAAKNACSISSFTNGPVLLAQYTLTLDQNYACTH